jgi:hypothetical protein
MVWRYLARMDEIFIGSVCIKSFLREALLLCRSLDNKEVYDIEIENIGKH